ncbi:MAG: hypothetical protein Kow0079_05010 [Vicingaceae bacterium]
MRPQKKIKDKLQLEKIKLQALLDASKLINRNASKDDLFGFFTRFLHQQLNIGKIQLYVVSEHWQQLPEYIHNTALKEQLAAIKEITVITENNNPYFEGFDVIIPVYHKKVPLAYLLLGDFDGEKIELSPIIKHLPFIQTFTNIITVAIENKRLYNESLKQAALNKELELAGEMQKMLLPSSFPKNKNFEVSSLFVPHRSIGGDYYDVIIKKNNVVYFCIADVSGKGIPAALLMSNFQANFRALIKRKTPLHEIVKELNNLIIQTVKHEKFITIFIGKINLNEKVLTYINCGHPPVVLICNQTIKYLDKGTVMLGVFDELPFLEVGKINLCKNDLLIAYTDGIIEQTNEQDKEYGIEGLTKTLSKLQNENAAHILNAIIQDLDDFKGDIPYNDDIALLAFSIKS